MIEAAYLLMDEDTFEPETTEHRRLNKSMVNELAREKPDHEKIYYLLNAINNVENGKQRTASFSSEEKPQISKIKGFKRWIKKIRKTRNQT
jgi:hypothetical protein